MTNSQLQEIVRSDLFRYHGDISLRGFITSFLKLEGFRYSYFLRKCRYYRTAFRPAFHYLAFILKQYKYKFGFDIPVECEIGKGLYIGHFGNVIVNPSVVIGSNVNVNHGVTVGRTNRGKRMGVPVIGDRVWLGANSIVVGRIRVGNNVLIGPGAYVNFDVPDNAVVIGNPGRVVSFKGAGGYINNLWPDNSSSAEETTSSEGISATNEGR